MGIFSIHVSHSGRRNITNRTHPSVSRRKYTPRKLQKSIKSYIRQIYHFESLLFCIVDRISSASLALRQVADTDTAMIH